MIIVLFSRKGQASAQLIAITVYRYRSEVAERATCHPSEHGRCHRLLTALDAVDDGPPLRLSNSVWSCLPRESPGKKSIGQPRVVVCPASSDYIPTVRFLAVGKVDSARGGGLRSLLRPDSSDLQFGERPVYVSNLHHRLCLA